MLRHAFLIYYLLGIGSISFAQLRAQSHPPSERVPLEGGRHLTLYCTGTGSPLVVLESGYGSDSLTWRRVQPLLAKHTRVCSYDRAGERFSDPGPYPRDLNAMVTDLHALSSEAHFSKPFVLVGHSMGGMTALLYAARYQVDVAALVLLDSGIAGMLKAYAVLPHAAKDEHGVEKGLAQLRRCRDLAVDPHQRAALHATCSWRDPEYSQPLNAE